MINCHFVQNFQLYTVNPMQVHIIFTILLLSFKVYLKSWQTTKSTDPKFNWDAKETLVELESFKTDVTILFDLNWLCRQATQIIKSQGITPRTHKEIYDALENFFRPESNDTIARFRFWSMKQKKNQSVDTYLTDQRLMIPECNYHKDALDDLLKDQFIFGITSR